MENQTPILAESIAYYLPLLERYAMRLTRDTLIAEQLVLQVLQDRYEIDGLLPSENLRLVLKNDLRNRCYCLKQSVIFDRIFVYFSLRQFVNPLLKKENDYTWFLN